MFPIIKIKHESKGASGLFWTIVDWWNIIFTKKYVKLNNGAKIWYMMFHNLLGKDRPTLLMKIKYAQLTKILEMNDAIKYD